MFSREISNFPNRKIITYVLLIQILTCNVSKETVGSGLCIMSNVTIPNDKFLESLLKKTPSVKI